MADDDDCEFPEDWGPPLEAEDDVAVEAEEAEAEAEPAVFEDDVAMEDDGAILEEEAEAEVEEEAVPIEDDEAEADEALSPVQAEEIEEDEDDEDLEAAEAAALAALGGGEAEVASEEEGGDEVAYEAAAPPQRCVVRPIGKAPIAKAPFVRAPIAKLPLAQPPWSRGPLPVLGKTPYGKGLGKGVGPAVAFKGFKAGKGALRPWDSQQQNFSGTPQAAKGANIQGNWYTGKGAKGKPLAKGYGAVVPSFAVVTRAPVRPAAAPARPPAAGGDGKGKAKGKAAPKDGGIGHRVVALNKAGHWQTGRGVSVQALQKLRELSQTDANKILHNLEAKAATVPNPSKFIQSAADAQLSVGNAPAKGKATSGKGHGSSSPAAAGVGATKPPWRGDATAGGTAATGAPAGLGIKRPAPPGAVAAPPAKRIIVPAPAVAERRDEECLAKLPTAVRAKVQEVQKRLEPRALDAAALRALAAAEQRDAQILLQALLRREDTDKKVANPSHFIIASLAKRLGAAGPAKAPLAKAPVVKAAIAKAPVAKAPQGGPVAGVGRPPVVRQGLEFEQIMVQEKLQCLNKIGVWTGPHPLDEAALASLLRIDFGRAMEILEDVEDQGAEIKNPSSFVINKIREDPR